VARNAPQRSNATPAEYPPGTSQEQEREQEADEVRHLARSLASDGYPDLLRFLHVPIY
jgi:hypothetical protein